MRPDALRELAAELFRLREMLDEVRLLSRRAALFAAPGQDPVSIQLAPPLRDTADDGSGSLSYELTFGLVAMERYIDELLAMATAYDMTEEANAWAFRQRGEA